MDLVFFIWGLIAFICFAFIARSAAVALGYFPTSGGETLFSFIILAIVTFLVLDTFAIFVF